MEAYVGPTGKGDDCGSDARYEARIVQLLWRLHSVKPIAEWRGECDTGDGNKI